MTDGPTTMNGPLHTDDATLDDRRMIASFATPAAAEAAQDALVDAGIGRDRISLVDHAADTTTPPADPGIIGRIREVLAPEDSETARRTAVRDDDAILTLRPLPHEVETAARILQAANPTHFDAALELWRNAPKP